VVAAENAGIGQALLACCAGEGTTATEQQSNNRKNMYFNQAIENPGIIPPNPIEDDANFGTSGDFGNQ